MRACPPFLHQGDRLFLGKHVYRRNFVAGQIELVDPSVATFSEPTPQAAQALLIQLRYQFGDLVFVKLIIDGRIAAT